MKKDKFRLSLIISALAVALLDVAYIVFLGIQIYSVSKGIGGLNASFDSFSTAIIAINSALLCYAVIYLIFRKR